MMGETPDRGEGRQLLPVRWLAAFGSSKAAKASKVANRRPTTSLAIVQIANSGGVRQPSPVRLRGSGG